MRLVTIILAGVVSLTGPAPVRAQGIGHGQPPVDPGGRGGVGPLPGPAPVRAQGIGHGQPPVDPGRRGDSGSTTTTQPTSTQPGTSSVLPTGTQMGTGLRLQTFGTWLDTTGVSAPGEAWISISSAYWRS